MKDSSDQPALKSFTAMRAAAAASGVQGLILLELALRLAVGFGYFKKDLFQRHTIAHFLNSSRP